MSVEDIQILSGVDTVQQIHIAKIITIEEAGLLESIPMSSIRPLNKQHVNNIAASDSSEWPPIELAHIRDTSKVGINYGVVDEYILVDGLHRYHAAIKKNMSTIASNIGSYTTIDQIVGAYLLANVKHGLPANRSARLVSALWLYDQHEDMTIEQIAARVSLPVSVVQRAIASLEASEETARSNGKVEDSEGKQARLLIMSLARFVLKQSDLLQRYLETADYENDIINTSLEIQSFISSATPKKRKEYQQAVKIVSEILDTVQMMSSSN